MKERLTGAIILVALLVLLVPELLTGPESKTAGAPGGAEGAQLRSYTIDLKDDAANRQPPPPQVPVAAATEAPASEATAPEAETESPPAAADVAPPVDDATRAAGKPMGSGADAPAANTEGPASADSSRSGAEPAASVAKSGSAAPPTSDDDKPRSAFGPNARTPENPVSAAKADAARKAEAERAEAARLAATKKADAERAEAARAEAARLAAAKAESARQTAAKAEASRVAAAKPATAGSKGWAVQLGVFGSRDNADRLAKQVKGSGFPVLINETTGKDGKKLYWVRVGPEAEQAGATALSAKLKAAGHRDARVVAYP